MAMFSTGEAQRLWRSGTVYAVAELGLWGKRCPCFLDKCGKDMSVAIGVPHRKRGVGYWLEMMPLCATHYDEVRESATKMQEAEHGNV